MAGNGSAVIVIESNVTPPIVLNGGDAGGLLAWFQPTVRAELPFSGPLTVAPYGPATPGLGVVVFYGVIGLALYGGWRLLTRR